MSLPRTTAAAAAAAAARASTRVRPEATAAAAAAAAAATLAARAGARRGYATPINTRSSLVPLLGTTPPPAPKPVDLDAASKEKSETSTSGGTADDETVKLQRWLQKLVRSGASPSSASAGTGGGDRLAATLERARNALLRPSQSMPGAGRASPQPRRQKLQTVEQRQANTRPAPSLRDKVLEAAWRLAHGPRKISASVEKLLELYTERAGRQLSVELRYESTPSPERRVPGASAADESSPTSSSASAAEGQDAVDDGVLLLAYVSNLDPADPDGIKLSLCTAFPIAVNAGDLDADDQPAGRGALAISCAHTLTTALLGQQGSKNASPEASTSSPSVAFALTRQGDVYAVRTLLSSLPQSDLILLQLSEQPVLIPRDQFSASSRSPGFFSRNEVASSSSSPSSSAFASASTGVSRKPLRTLPVSPYPAHPGETILVSSFDGWDSSPSSAETEKHFPGGAYDAADGRGSERAPSGSSRTVGQRWGTARLIEYKDGANKEARVGTYDDLHQLDFRLLSAANHVRPKLASVTVPMPDDMPADERAQEAAAAEGEDEDEEETIRRVLPGLARPDNMHLLDRALASLSRLPIAAKQPATSQTAPSAAAPLSSRSSPGLNSAPFPPPGSSGGPIVAAREGCVVGVVRGSRTSVLEGHRGDGVPAEKIFEMFSLPGLGKKKLAERKARASSAQQKAEQPASDRAKEP
ncbi:hypothetical protein OC834_001459 [Tilletia horrida]|nr:hypothetical protein OC834_001459 [Tilletia horrida]